MKNLIAGFLLLASLQAVASSDLTFMRDNRPVDGALTKLIIAPNNGFDLNASTVTLEVAFNSRIEGREISESIFENKNMDCKRTFTTYSFTIERVVCSRDDRPSDSAFTELTVLINKYETYDVFLFTSYAQEPKSKTDYENLAHNLEFIPCRVICSED